MARGLSSLLSSAFALTLPAEALVSTLAAPRRGMAALAAAGDTGALASTLLDTRPYTAPDWAEALQAPNERVELGRLPTPIHKWPVPLLEDLGVQWWIKRDDLTGFELGGNKVRKLEFLLAEAKAGGYDCVVTIGGIQSNHCRATAAAARMLGLPSYLILRTSEPDKDPGLVGNLLFDRMLGAEIRTVTPEEYGRVGSARLGEMLVEELRGAGLKPYLIPVGGSNPLGTWGYLEGVRELQTQMPAVQGLTDGRFDHVTFACGSGGTAAGIGLGMHLSGLGQRGTKVHAVGVCDSPSYFYKFVDDEILPGIGQSLPCSESWLRVIQGRGRGYAVSTPEELDIIKRVCETTGVLLDPVYSGKALYKFCETAKESPEEFAGKSILFWHTGGGFGMYDKAEQLMTILPEGKVKRMVV